MQKWEYQRIQVKVDQINTVDAKLTQLGDQGWEVCGMATTVSQTGAAFGAAFLWVHILLKRPKA